MHCFLERIRGLRIRVACALAAWALTFGTTNARESAVIAAPTATPIAPVPQMRVQDIGRTPRTARIRIALALNYRNEPELEALIRAASDPSSPAYGQFLSP